MNYRIGSDLAVSSSNIWLSIPNPAPGQNVTISAMVQNLGELGAANVQAAFYDGDPSAGGVQIGSTQTVAGVLSAGGTATVQVNWAVPPRLSSATIYVVVDPALLQPDRNPANNTASLTMMAPDLAIDSMDVLTPDPTNPVITAHVINQGALSSGHSVNVVFYQGATNGPALATVSIPALDAGGAYDATFAWPMAGLTFTSAVVTVYAVVDPTGTVSEFGAANTVGSTPVPTPLSLPPPLLTATAAAYNQINLSWSGISSNATGFIISRSVNGGVYSVIATPGGNATSLTDSTAGCGDSYVYMIVATNSSGASDTFYISAATSGFDSEGYGIPDCWRVEYFGHPDARAADLSRALDDADGDGMNNLKEYLTGTDPTNRNSVFRITSVQKQGNDFNVRWQTAGGRTNVLQAASGLSAGFSNVSPNIVLPGSGDTFTNYLDVGAATNGGPRFYRVELPTAFTLPTK